MAAMYCNNCGGWVGDCGHVQGGLTSPVTISGNCPHCRKDYRVTCKGCFPSTAIDDPKDLDTFELEKPLDA